MVCWSCCRHTSPVTLHRAANQHVVVNMSLCFFLLAANCCLAFYRMIGRPREHFLLGKTVARDVGAANEHNLTVAETDGDLTEVVDATHCRYWHRHVGFLQFDAPQQKRNTCTQESDDVRCVHRKRSENKTGATTRVERNENFAAKTAAYTRLYGTIAAVSSLPSLSSLSKFHILIVGAIASSSFPTLTNMFLEISCCKCVTPYSCA